MASAPLWPNICEKALFGSAELVAAAVTYAASQITLLTSLGDVATANKGAGSDLLVLRRAVERDRYGLMAYVLTARDRCTPSACRAFRSLTETRQIAANMEDRVYESLVMRYTAVWNAPQAAAGMLAALPPSVPTGKPTNAEFPTSASTPPVSIMTPEPPAGAPKPSSATAAAPASPAAPRPVAATPPASPPAQAAAKKPPAARAGAEAAVQRRAGPARAVGAHS